MADIRQTEIANAQNNPNILSPLVGATAPTPMQAPTGGNLAALAGQQTSPQQAQNTAGQVGQQMAQSLYGTGSLQGMSNNWDQMIGELGKFDSQMEQQYPPSMPGIVSNPVDKSGYLANQAQTTGGNISKTQSAVSSINQAYQNAVSSVVDKFLQFYQLTEDRRYKETEARRQSEKDRLDRLLQVLGITGGKYKDETTGQEYNIPSQADRDKSTRVAKKEIVELPDGRTVLFNFDTNEIIQDFGKKPNIFEQINGNTGTTEQKPTEPKPTFNLGGSTTESGSATLNKPSLESIFGPR